MRLNMKVVFDRTDMEEILKTEYVKRFGVVQPEYDLSVHESYGEWTVEMYKKEVVEEEKAQ